MTNPTTDILTLREGRAGRIRLNRPKAINSLNDVMVDGLQKALTTWENDASVRSVLLTGAGERGLCAGGDVVTIAVTHAAPFHTHWPGTRIAPGGGAGAAYGGGGGGTT